MSFYYLFPELVPATYYIEMDPGLADREGSGLADDIATADFLVLTNIWTGWNEPNASDEHLSDEHNQAVADNFCLVGTTRTTSCCCSSAAKAAAASAPPTSPGPLPRSRRKAQAR